MRQKHIVWCGALALAFTLAGCSSSSNQPLDTSSSNPSTASSSSAPATPAPPPPLVIPAGTELTVRLETALGSKTSNEGDPFEATVTEPVMAGGNVAIPKGASASGVVTQAHAAGHFKGGATLDLVLKSVTINGTSYAVQSSSITKATKGKGKRSATFIGGGAVGGALLGGLLGGGKGAAIGAAAGAGAGTAGAGLSGNRDIVLPVETLLNFKLTSELSVKQGS